MLDPALLRPGRLDRKIEIPLPNEHARTDIMKIHASGITKHGDIDFEAIVKLAENFNGADMRNVCTEAGMFAIRDERDYVVQEDFMKVCAVAGLPAPRHSSLVPLGHKEQPWAPKHISIQAQNQPTTLGTVAEKLGAGPRHACSQYCSCVHSVGTQQKHPRLLLWRGDILRSTPKSPHTPRKAMGTYGAAACVSSSIQLLSSALGGALGASRVIMWPRL